MIRKTLLALVAALAIVPQASYALDLGDVEQYEQQQQRRIDALEQQLHPLTPGEIAARNAEALHNCRLLAIAPADCRVDENYGRLPR